MKKLLLSSVAIVCCLFLAFTTHAANSSQQVLPCDTLVCDDADACTTDSCSNTGGGFCTFNSIICDDADLCTIDTCAGGFCFFTPIVCDDADPCTFDTCDGGSCVFTAFNCNDADLCTIDTCDGGSCVFTLVIICDDTYLCTYDYCDGNSGTCVFISTCDDGNLCTTDSCVGGQCSFTAIPACTNPCDTLVCNDNDLCTTDSCFNGFCIFTPNIPVDCNGDCGGTASIDSCGICSGGNSGILPNCGDADFCTIDECDGLGGCIHMPVDCDDANYCTTDSCAGTSCVNTPIPGCSLPSCYADFVLFADTIPHHYFIWNGVTATAPLSYLWSWGDGATDTIAYPSHTYSAAGNYTICLKITSADGCTDSLCAPYNLMKEGGEIIYVQVVDSLPTAIQEAVLPDMQLYPNPTNGSITLKAPSATKGQTITLRLFDSLGKLVWQLPAESAEMSNGVVIDLSNNSEGIYYLHLQSANNTRVMKVVKY